jgi:hypothetical protein
MEISLIVVKEISIKACLFIKVKEIAIATALTAHSYDRIDWMNNKHEVLIGPYRSGKSWLLLERALKHCLDAAKNSQESSLDSETIILVPSQRYRKLIERRLNKLVNKEITSEPAEKAINPGKISGFWGLKILTFYQFCQTYLLQAGIFTKLLPEAAKSALLSAVCHQLMQAGKISKLKPIINASGTQASILSLIDEWQRAGYTANDIIKKVKMANSNINGDEIKDDRHDDKKDDRHEVKDDRYEIKDHRRELAEIFSAYQKALKELHRPAWFGFTVN